MISEEAEEVGRAGHEGPVSWGKYFGFIIGKMKSLYGVIRMTVL
jgi:hypothetical protein